MGGDKPVNLRIYTVGGFFAAFDSCVAFSLGYVSNVLVFV